VREVPVRAAAPGHEEGAPVRRVRVVTPAVYETGDRTFQAMRYSFRGVEVGESEATMDWVRGWWYVVRCPRGFTYTRNLSEAIQAFTYAIRTLTE
jgi:hypothetical protein